MSVLYAIIPLVLERRNRWGKKSISMKNGSIRYAQFVIKDLIRNVASKDKSVVQRLVLESSIGEHGNLRSGFLNQTDISGIMLRTIPMLFGYIKRCDRMADIFWNTVLSWSKFLVAYLNQMSEYIIRMASETITGQRILSYGRLAEKTHRANELLIGSLITCESKDGR